MITFSIVRIFLIVCVYDDYKTSHLSPKFAVNNSFLRNTHSSKGRKTVWRLWRPWLAGSRSAAAFARQVSFSLKTRAGRIPVTRAPIHSSDVSVRIFPTGAVQMTSILSRLLTADKPWSVQYPLPTPQYQYPDGVTGNEFPVVAKKRKNSRKSNDSCKLVFIYIGWELFQDYC